MAPLDGCRAKIHRARFHIGELGEMVRAFVEHSPYNVHLAVDEAANEVVFTAVANPLFSPTSITLTLIAGEVAHQLRSALDHLVWQLVIANTGQPPQGTRSQFPIFKTEAGYDQRAADMIEGVSANAATRIRAAQPFHAGAHAERVLTWVVHELNNTDKHRIIPLTTTYSFVGRLLMVKADGTEVEILPRRKYVRESLHDGEEIVRVPVGDGMDG